MSANADTALISKLIINRLGISSSSDLIKNAISDVVVLVACSIIIGFQLYRYLKKGDYGRPSLALNSLVTICYLALTGIGIASLCLYVKYQDEYSLIVKTDASLLFASYLLNLVFIRPVTIGHFAIRAWRLWDRSLYFLIPAGFFIIASVVTGLVTMITAFANVSGPAGNLGSLADLIKNESALTTAFATLYLELKIWAALTLFSDIFVCAALSYRLLSMRPKEAVQTNLQISYGAEMRSVIKSLLVLVVTSMGFPVACVAAFCGAILGGGSVLGYSRTIASLAAASYVISLFALLNNSIVRKQSSQTSWASRQGDSSAPATPRRAMQFTRFGDEEKNNQPIDFLTALEAGSRVYPSSNPITPDGMPVTIGQPFYDLPMSEIASRTSSKTRE